MFLPQSTERNDVLLRRRSRCLVKRYVHNAPITPVEERRSTIVSMRKGNRFEALTPLRDALNRLCEESFIWWSGLLIVASLLIAGCSPFTTSSPTSGNSSVKPASSFTGLVDIGGGRKMYLDCRGSGSPTVVFVSGRSDRADIWSTLANPRETGPAVLPGTATFTRVCAYDRPGTYTVTG